MMRTEQTGEEQIKIKDKKFYQLLDLKFSKRCLGYLCYMMLMHEGNFLSFDGPWLIASSLKWVFVLFYILLIALGIGGTSSD